MANFKIAYNKTLLEEGGLNDNPNDAGGLTMMGVCYRDWNNEYPMFFIIVNNYIKVSELDLAYKLPNDTDINKKNRRMRIKQCKELVYKLCNGNNKFMEILSKIYKTYWDKCKLELLNNQDAANTIFDFAFNAGANRAVRYAQRIVNTKEDGIMGTISINAINNADNFVKDYNDARKSYYQKISAKNSNQVFLGGWIKRTDKFYV